jgi:hypothetical protein
MTQVVDRTRKHGADNLENHKARSGIDVRLSRPFKGNEEYRNLQRAEEEEAGT